MTSISLQSPGVKKTPGRFFFKIPVIYWSLQYIVNAFFQIAVKSTFSVVLGVDSFHSHVFDAPRGANFGSAFFN